LNVGRTYRNECTRACEWRVHLRFNDGSIAMCGIAGIISNSEEELGGSLRTMLETMHHRGPDGAGYVIGDHVEHKGALSKLDFGGRKGRAAFGHVRLAITGDSSALQPFRSGDGSMAALHNGEIYNYRDLWRAVAEGEPPRGNDSEVLMRHLERGYQGDLFEDVQRVLPKLDGVYALAITDQRQTVLVRDRVGVKQLYYVKSNGHVAFASERKPLWKLKGRDADIHRLGPGNLLKIGESGVEEARFWDPVVLRQAPMFESRDEALRAYDQSLRAALKKRLAGRDRVGIIFSGGIDSLLIAYLVREMGIPFRCYTVGCGENSPDIEWSVRLAKQFGFPIETCELSEADVEALLPEVIRDIEDHSLNQVEVSVPMYAANRMAQEAGERVLLTGQGADELFGGYSWYPKVVEQDGYDAFVERSWEDTCYLYKECLEREDKISMAHSMELRVPYLDPVVIEAAFQVRPEWKVNVGRDVLGKRLHREYCSWIGIPDDISNRVKEAAQHGANVHDTITALAEKRVPDEGRLAAAGYEVGRSVREKLGSSSRYGYRYGEEHLWKPLPVVQYYLDGLAAEQEVLLPGAEEQLREVQGRVSL
jgi:asparagine synthase (glutamine-hydrolysing)